MKIIFLSVILAGHGKCKAFADVFWKRNKDCTSNMLQNMKNGSALPRITSPTALTLAVRCIVSPNKLVSPITKGF